MSPLRQRLYYIINQGNHGCWKIHQHDPLWEEIDAHGRRRQWKKKHRQSIQWSS